MTSAIAAPSRPGPARRVTCPRGHAMDESNTYVVMRKTPSGPKPRRLCRECQRMRAATNAKRRGPRDYRPRRGDDGLYRLSVPLELTLDDVRFLVGLAKVNGRPLKDHLAWGLTELVRSWKGSRR